MEKLATQCSSASIDLIIISRIQLDQYIPHLLIPSSFHNPPRAYLVALGTVANGAWYPDSEATHHLTHDHRSLLTNSKFDRAKQVHLGNSSATQIKHIGSSPLYSFKFNSNFNLSHPLHVPEIIKNLIMFRNLPLIMVSILDLFWYLFCQILGFQGKLRDGLYVFEDVFVPGHHLSFRHHFTYILTCSSFPSAFNTTCTSDISIFPLWHRRLGHPYKKIVSKVLFHCNVSFSDNKHTIGSNKCTACCMAKIHQLPHPLSSHKYFAPLDLVISNI